ncbi:hypothetical protein TNIN_108851 [Trichonephila inaurata madagascariensis]|uniref:Uncharacterized protein n=1 Tax=Trichonephila inaurata madagascariensis TaxID=2747483 RepID=A0A8X7BY59_9ARAC|nr:hypothetical protein TNIN_108851 [Trichonephila inaurata madagascariensis]
MGTNTQTIPTIERQLDIGREDRPQEHHQKHSTTRLQASSQVKHGFEANCDLFHFREELRTKKTCSQDRPETF